MSLRRRFDRMGRRAGRERLLFISPVTPALHGNGLAMRAAHTLLAFAGRYDVTLLIIPIYASPAGGAPPEQVRAACERVVTVQPNTARPPLFDERFDIVHIFRRATVPLARPWLNTNAERWLDLDDIESVAHRRAAELRMLAGDAAEAADELARADAAEADEAAAYDQFDRVFVAAIGDAERRARPGRVRIVPLPNVLPLPAPLPEPLDAEPVSLLFVGTLGYQPNVEGALWFAREALPLIRRESSREVAFEVVGMGWMPLVEELRLAPGVALTGAVPEVRPAYEQATLVVAPIFVGGGTRIKIIEAFGLGRAVVSTTVGVEGLEVVPEEHALLADDAEAFALACLRLLDDGNLRRSIAQRARRLAAGRYTPEALAHIVAGWPASR